MDAQVAKKPSFVSRYLDVLYEVKFKLALKKIEGKIVVAKNEFRKMIEEETTKDLDVRDAIDKLFEPLNIFSNEGDNYNMKDKDAPATNNKGVAKSKALPQFKNTGNNEQTSN